MIKITVRDINGMRRVIECYTEGDVIRSINSNRIEEDDEILLVTQDKVCLYSALGADHPITMDDLTGFFG